nr:immunoglobulin light chain junction region [Macaca mulatta]MOW06730.1 immunoglobulin light chain junction region [Macaca mulatta]
DYYCCSYAGSKTFDIF